MLEEVGLDLPGQVGLVDIGADQGFFDGFLDACHGGSRARESKKSILYARQNTNGLEKQTIRIATADPARKKNRNGKGRGWSWESRGKRTVEKGNYRRRDKNGERSSIDNQPRLIIYRPQGEFYQVIGSIKKLIFVANGIYVAHCFFLAITQSARPR